MQFQRNDGTSADDIVRNQFIAYAGTAFFREMIRYAAHRKQYITEINAEPDDIERLLQSQSYQKDYSAAEAAGFSPQSWEEVMDSIENPKLDRILSQLTPEEQELMFYRLFHHLSYKDIAIRKRKCAKEVQTRYDTTIRKLRRWWGKE